MPLPKGMDGERNRLNSETVCIGRICPVQSHRASKERYSILWNRDSFLVPVNFIHGGVSKVCHEEPTLRQSNLIQSCCEFAEFTKRGMYINNHEDRRRTATSVQDSCEIFQDRVLRVILHHSSIQFVNDLPMFHLC